MNFSSSLLLNTIKPATESEQTLIQDILPGNPHECVHFLPPCSIHFLVLFQSITTGHLYQDHLMGTSKIVFFFTSLTIYRKRDILPLLALRPSERARVLMLVVLLDFVCYLWSLSSDILLSNSLAFAPPLSNWLSSSSCSLEPSLLGWIANGWKGHSVWAFAS